jgi:hypothetical protein
LFSLCSSTHSVKIHAQLKGLPQFATVLSPQVSQLQGAPYMENLSSPDSLPLCEGQAWKTEDRSREHRKHERKREERMIARVKCLNGRHVSTCSSTVMPDTHVLTAGSPRKSCMFWLCCLVCFVCCERANPARILNTLWRCTLKDQMYHILHGWITQSTHSLNGTEWSPRWRGWGMSSVPIR